MLLRRFQHLSALHVFPVAVIVPHLVCWEHSVPPEPSDLSASLRLDLTNACLWRGMQRILLRPKTFAVLRCLLAHPGQLVSKAALLDAVWPETTVNDVALMICIRELRQALGDDPRAPRFIETMHRRGYRFMGDLPVIAPASDSPPAAMHSALPPVGRQVEMTRLHTWLARARSGVRQVVFVTGEAGLGKTTLVEAVVAEIGDHGPLWIGHGQCVEHYGAGEAYMPVLEALGRLCRGPDGQEVVTLLGQQAPTWLVQMPGLVRAADLETLKRRIVGATRERMLRELAEALDLLTTRQPLVLVLEDLHWSDPSTLDLLAVLARRREPARLLVIGTYRPPEVRRRAHPLHNVTQELQLHGHSVELPLTLLSEDAVATYLASRLSGLSQVDRLARLVHQRTEGNPLFMVALVVSWLTQGLLLEQDGAWALPTGIEALQDSVPESLRQMIDRQLDGLSAEEQQVLEAASVAGMEFSAAAVAAGLAQETEDADNCCASLARREQFLRASGEQTWPDGTVAGCYRFIHALYQQVLYQRVSAAQRVRLHLHIGARLEVGHGAQAGNMAAELAVHFERGRDDQRAVQYLWQAGQRSIERSAYVEATAHLTKGLEVLKTLPDTTERTRHELDLLLTLGPAVNLVKGQASPEYEHVYVQAHALCQQLGDTPQLFSVLTGLRQLYNARGELQTARQYCEQAMALAQRLQDPALLRAAHYSLGVVLDNLGEVASAHAHFAQGITLADAQCNNRSGAWCRMYGAWGLWLLGYPDQALHWSHEALTLAQSLDPYSRYNALRKAGQIHEHRREVQAAHTRYEAALALATEHGFVEWVPIIMNERGGTLAALGHSAAGITQMRQGIATLQTRRILPGLLARLAEAYGNSGQAETGLSVLAEALAVMDTTEARRYEAQLYWLKGELLLRQVAPDAPQAEACFQQALTVARRQQARSWELRAATSLSRLWQQQGKEAEARQLLEPIYGWFTEGFDTTDLQEAKMLLDKLA
jgi:DNA-binding winged helix-turn-helix (wHTH) protein/predicted ATPase